MRKRGNMGILDRIARRVLNTAIDSVVDSFMNGSDTEKSGEANAAPSTAATAAKAASTAQTGDYSYENGGEEGVRFRLETIFKEFYSDCEVRRDVPPSVVGAPENAQHFTYGLYRNGEPAALIIIMNKRGNYRRRDYKSAREACSERGVPYAHFMSYLPSNRDYIINKLKEIMPG